MSRKKSGDTEQKRELEGRRAGLISRPRRPWYAHEHHNAEVIRARNIADSTEPDYPFTGLRWAERIINGVEVALEYGDCGWWVIVEDGSSARLQDIECESFAHAKIVHRRVLRAMRVRRLTAE